MTVAALVIISVMASLSTALPRAGNSRELSSELISYIAEIMEEQEEFPFVE
jgi:hypothetical protein